MGVGGNSSEIESDISQPNSALAENLEKLHQREDLEPVMRWAEEVIAAEPATSLSQAGIDTLSQEKKSKFGKLGERQKWAAISTLAAAAVLLIPSLSPHGAAQKDQQEELRVCSGISTLAAAVTIRAEMPSSDALSLLELGRGIIAASRYEIREDLTLLKGSPHKELAAKFEKLRDSLDSFTIPPGASPEVEEEIAQQRLEACLDLEDVVKRIRKSKGFESFLLPPSVDELKSAAAEGPIIIVNVSFQCDAILIHSGKIESIPLPGLNESDIKTKLEILKDKGRREKEIELVLEWLWDTVAEPILNSKGLGFTKMPSREDEWPRVWWVLTGSLALFPIHAAGKHRELLSLPGNSVLDRVVSSYSPTVKALFYARENRTKRRPLKPADKIILVSMEDDEGLQYVEHEIKVLSALLPTRTLLESPPRKDILVNMDGCKIFHFAGHAKSDFEDPSRSRLVVSRGRDPVTVLDVAALKLYESPPLLAYLSACSTGNGESEGLLDEGIHVMGAFQLAGFQNVIGSLWELYDSRSEEVASNVYTFMKNPVEGESVALALHKTLRALRSTRPVVARAKDFNCFHEGVKAEKTRFYIGEPVVWAAYIHMGI